MINELLLSNNKKMKYFKFGSGKKVIAMIPGLSIKSVMEYEGSIKNDYNIFSKEYTIYCFDRIEKPNSNYSIYNMAEDTYLAIKELGLKEVYLLGASQGGIISMLIAINHKDIYKKIAIASSTAKIDNSDFSKINEWIKLAESNKKEELMLDFSKMIYPDDLYKKSINLCKDIAKTITKEELDKFIIMAKTIKDIDITNDIFKIDKPFLMVGDKKDSLFGIKPITELTNIKKDIKSYIYDGYGHALYDLASDFKQIVYSFFEE